MCCSGFFVFFYHVKLKPLKLVPALIVLSVVLGFGLIRFLNWDLFERLECMTYDMRLRQALRSPSSVSTNLGFVFIDEESIRAVQDHSLGYSFGLYWPRQVYARVVNELREQGAKAIAFDVIFGNLRPDHPPVMLSGNRVMESDEFFAYELQQAGNVLLAVTSDLQPPMLFATNAASLGDISTDKDPDGILRKARAFQVYRQWHQAFREVEADPGYGVDLRMAKIAGKTLVLPRSNGENITFPLDDDGQFALADFYGDKLPEGLPEKAKPFFDQRVWHMGVALAARELGLDLDKAQVDFKKGVISLSGTNGQRRVIPIDHSGCFYIDWCMPPDHPQLLRESVQGLLRQNLARTESQGAVLTNRWAGKLAIVGSAAMVGNDLTDRGATPLRSDTLLVSKHWNVANSIINNAFVRRTGLITDLLLILVMGILAAVLTWEFRAVQAFLLVLLLAIAYILITVVVFIQTRWWMPIAIPVVGSLVVMHLALVTWRVVFEQADKRRVKSLFAKVVSPKIVNELLISESLKLGGTRREITVMFADVRGFTELTDRTQDQITDYVKRKNLTGPAAEAAYDEQARDTLRTVNTYLGLVADTIIGYDGTLDKFIGDCVMAFWGAPTPNRKHAVSCVRAAIAAQRAIAEVNEQRALENLRREKENLTRAANGLEPLTPLPLLLLGSGINTGMAIVGLMGSKEETCNYTVFGREVNLASRLESLSGRGRIFISHATYEHLRRDDPELAATCVALPPVLVKGIRSEVSVYEVPWKLTGTAIIAAVPSSQPDTDSLQHRLSK